MDKYKEIVKIQNQLKIPVSDINIFSSYVEIISGKEILSCNLALLVQFTIRSRFKKLEQ